MPIVGNLSEFPLPEVLLLIGQRTGRLRLLDVPEFGVLELDVSTGAVQAMRIGSTLVTETPQMLDKLGVVLQAESGMFDFQLIPVSLTANPKPLTIHDLAMKLVCHVDEQAAQERRTSGGHQCYRLVDSEPEIWMEPELDQFLFAVRPLLAQTVALDELAQSLQMEPGLAFQNLTKLRLLGFVEMIDTGEVIRMEEPVQPHPDLIRKTQAYIQVAHMTDRIRKLSSRLPAV